MGTGATWISSKRRAYHVYAGLYELDESPVIGIGERAEDAGIVGDGFWAEQLLVYLFASGHVSIDGPGHRCGYHAQGHDFDNNPVLF
jgi:hypothetical protein